MSDLPAPRRRDIVGATFAIPPVAIVILALMLAFAGGGVVETVWVPYAVGIVAALATLAAVGAMPAVPRAAVPALVALALLIGWSAVSLTWSHSREATMAAVARLALLAAAFAVGAIFAARPRPALVLAAAVSCAAAVVAAILVGHLLAGDLDVFRGSRLSWPVAYANGAAATFLIGVPGALAFAGALPLRPAARAAALAAGTLTLAVAVATQSRGGSLAVVVALAATVVATRDRHRTALMLAAMVLPVAAVVPLLVRSTAPTTGNTRAVGVAVIGAVVVAGGLGLGLAMLDRRSLPPFGARGTQFAAALWVVLALGLGTAFVVHLGDPVVWVGDRWSEFWNVHAPTSADSTRFGTAQSNRSDYYRVGFEAGSSNLITGVGAGAFAVPWFQHRTVYENVDDAHSWPVGMFAELGIVGLVLAAGALLAPFAGSRRARRGGEAWPIAGAALTGQAVYFVAHGSVEWLLRIPASGLVGMTVLGALAAAGSTGNQRLAEARQRIWIGAVGAVAVALAIPSYISVRLYDDAERQAAIAPVDAIGILADAATVDPFAVQPLELKATLLLARGDGTAALAAAAEATRRGPNDWTAWALRLQVAKATGAPTAEAAARLAALNPLRS